MDAMHQQQALSVTVPGLYLQFLPPNLRDKARDYFVYGLEWSTLAGGATRQETAAVQDDSHFLMCAVSGVVVDPTDESTQTTFPPVTLRFEDVAASRNLDNRAIHWTTVVGTGQLPAYLPYPRIFQRRSTIGVTASNLTAATDLRIRLSLIGFKIFPNIREWDGR